MFEINRNHDFRIHVVSSVQESRIDDKTSRFGRALPQDHHAAMGVANDFSRDRSEEIVRQAGLMRCNDDDVRLCVFGHFKNLI